MNLERFQQARDEFDRKYKGKKRYTLAGPALAIGQGALFISQFSAISTLANLKVRQQPVEASLSGCCCCCFKHPSMQHTLNTNSNVDEQLVSFSIDCLQLCPTLGIMQQD
jgi:hypothetical protein